MAPSSWLDLRSRGSAMPPVPRCSVLGGYDGAGDSSAECWVLFRDSSSTHAYLVCLTPAENGAQRACVAWRLRTVQAKRRSRCLGCSSLVRRSPRFRTRRSARSSSIIEVNVSTFLGSRIGAHDNDGLCLEALSKLRIVAASPVPAPPSCESRSQLCAQRDPLVVRVVSADSCRPRQRRHLVHITISPIHCDSAHNAADRSASSCI
jgi:hypothetical protein